MPIKFSKNRHFIAYYDRLKRWRWTRGNHFLEIFENPNEIPMKSEISYALARYPFENREISYLKLGSELPLGGEQFQKLWMSC